MRAGPLTHVRRRLARGLALVLPLLITVWLLSILFNLINDNVTPWVRGIFEWVGVPGLERLLAKLGIPVIGLVLTVAFIYLLGLLAGNLAGRRIVAMIERFILRIPLVKGIYGSARQLLDAFSMGGQKTFSKVVIIEYPRNGLWTVGFVTTETEHQVGLPSGDGPRTVPVFLPTTPNPTSGWMILVPTTDLRVLDMTVEDGIKLIVSGGIVSPDDLGELISEWPSGA